MRKIKPLIEKHNTLNYNEKCIEIWNILLRTHTGGIHEKNAEYINKEIRMLLKKYQLKRI